MKEDIVPSPTKRQGTAVLAIDVQQQVFAHVHDRAPVLARIEDVVAQAHRVGTPVIWVQQSDDDLVHGSPRWQIVDELTPASGDTVVHKRHGDSFAGTDLDEVLADLGVGHLVVLGAMTDHCVRMTLHSGLTRGYRVTLVADAHTCADVRPLAADAPSPAQVIVHTNLYWANQGAPGDRSAVVRSAELVLDRRRP